MYSINLDYKQLIDKFLKFKRLCGYKYHSEENILKSFYSYLQLNKDSRLGLSKKLLDKWIMPNINESRKSLSNRVSVIRELSIYLNQLGYKTYVPKVIKNSTNKTFIPYIFSHEQIKEIFAVIDNWPQSNHNRYNSNDVYPVLFRLLYGCGLRISEALNLKIKNIDIQTGVISIDIAKYDKKRIVVMHESLKKICDKYKTTHLLSKDPNSTFFQHKDGKPRDKCQVNNFFRQILYKANIAYQGKGKGPYLHNLRHTFACHSFYKMHQKGIDMQVGLSLLSTYLGHSSTNATQRYLRLTQDIFPDIIKMDNISSNVYLEVKYEE
jgi:integrase